MKFNSLFLRLDLVTATSMIVLAFLVFINLPEAIASYKIRKSVIEGMHKAEIVKSNIEDNAILGMDLAHGVKTLTGPAEVVISVLQDTGVVTVTFPMMKDKSANALTLIPVYYEEGQGYLLSAKVKSGKLVERGKILWICTSSLTRSDDDFINQHIGTLEGKYAPAKCRYILENVHSF